MEGGSEDEYSPDSPWATSQRRTRNTTKRVCRPGPQNTDLALGKEPAKASKRLKRRRVVQSDDDEEESRTDAYAEAGAPRRVCHETKQPHAEERPGCCDRSGKPDAATQGVSVRATSLARSETARGPSPRSHLAQLATPRQSVEPTKHHSAKGKGCSVVDLTAKAEEQKVVVKNEGVRSKQNPPALLDAERNEEAEEDEEDLEDELREIQIRRKLRALRKRKRS